MRDNYCVIMAGGIGSRFWPLSRQDRPKQFLDILGTGKTLIQMTYERLTRICPAENLYIVTSENYKHLIKEQIPSISEGQILCEPGRRNTAPCVAYASYKIQQINPNARLLFAPSDHLILKEDLFVDEALRILELTKDSDALYTMGIQPHRPDTGYGYIQMGTDTHPEVSAIKKVDTFTEKPNLEKAKEFLSAGNYSWNSGIFFWSAKTIVNEIEEHLPKMAELFKQVNFNTRDEYSDLQQLYPSCESISIDYGIMEKASNVFVLPVDPGWSDLGTWGSLYEHSDKDEFGNSAPAKGDVFTYDTKDSVINIPDNKVAVVQGLEDYIVVDTSDILLICKKENEQDIKKFSGDVKENLPHFS